MYNPLNLCQFTFLEVKVTTFYWLQNDKLKRFVIYKNINKQERDKLTVIKKTKYILILFVVLLP